MYYFCTYFDRNFIYQGLALYESLKQHAGKFKLWVLCHDDDTYQILKRLNLPNLNIIHIEDIEKAYPILKTVKKERSHLEYLFTTTPMLPHHILKTHKFVDLIAYLDADLFFYSCIEPIYSELGSGSIYIIPHRFDYNQHAEKNAGKYNVGMVIIRRDSSGLACLETWKNQCLEKCHIDEKDFTSLGDQKYLDEWPRDFPDTIVSHNIGIGAGGWNIMNYNISKRNGKVYIDECRLIMLHLNFIELINDRLFTGYPRWRFLKLYKPYIKSLRWAINSVKRIDPRFTLNSRKIPLRLILKRVFRGGVVPI